MAERSSDEINIIIEQPGARDAPAEPSDEPGFRPRRAHSKSRTGCLNCRRRRIKCNEQRPTCLQCSDRELRCEYRTASRPAESTQPTAGPAYAEASSVDRESARLQAMSISPPAGAEGNNEREAARVQLMSILTEANFPTSHFANATYRKEDAVELFEHFTQPTDIPWIGSRDFQRIAQGHGAETALGAPWVLHALLAFSASHLSTLQPAERRYGIASALHYSHALSLYAVHLNTIPAVPDLDARLEAIFLHAMLAFLNAPSASKDTPWGQDDGPTWIPSIIGISSLLSSPCFGRFPYDRTVWEPFLDKYRESTPREDTQLGQYGSLAERQALADIESICDAELDSGKRDKYQTQLAGLRKLVELPAQHESVDAFMSFIANTSMGFRSLLKANDARSLLILGLWCALFGRIEQWWITGSARIECQRICAHLNGLDDASIDPPLRFLVDWSGLRLEGSQ